MILADTSDWINYRRAGDPALSAALEPGRVLVHSCVLGELACGNLRKRRKVLELVSQGKEEQDWDLVYLVVPAPPLYVSEVPQ